MWYHVYNLTAYFVAALLGFVALVLMYYKHAFNHWKKLNVPHLEPSFPFGNMKSNFAKYIGQQIAQIYQDMKNKGHKYCGYFLFGAPVFMPISSEMNKYFLITDFKSFSDRGFHSDEINDPMGASLVTFSGEKWKRWREKLTPMFTSQKTKMMLPIVQKCTQELDIILSNYNNSECLRKYPTVHMLNRIVSQDFVIPETNIVIKKGTKAMLSTMGLHRDPEYYPNPEKFDPDRFSDENKDQIPPFAYLPFGGGPRICPGMRFGILESKLCLATIISKFRIIIHPSMKPLELCSVGNVLGTENPILLKAEILCNNNNNK